MFRPPNPTSMELNLAPMVDVMMCLIIFFLLASKLVSEGRQPIELPYAIAAQTEPPETVGTRVVINVRKPADNNDTQAEYIVADWDGRRVTTRSLTPAQVEPFLHASARDARRDAREIQCVIRADRDLRYEHVEVILRACGLAKIRHVVFSANEGPAPEDAS